MALHLLKLKTNRSIRPFLIPLFKWPFPPSNDSSSRTPFPLQIGYESIDNYLFDFFFILKTTIKVDRNCAEKWANGWKNWARLKEFGNKSKKRRSFFLFFKFYSRFFLAEIFFFRLKNWKKTSFDFLIKNWIDFLMRNWIEFLIKNWIEFLMMKWKEFLIKKWKEWMKKIEVERNFWFFEKKFKKKLH